MGQRFFKGRTNNHLTFMMVDATDFATPESALSGATKIKIYGKLRAGTGTNLVSSGQGSLTNDITHVGASALGLYTIALAKADLSDASAAWYDQYIISLSATGAAYQTIIAEGVIDDSTTSGVISDIYSALVALSDATSNAYSAAVVGASRALLIQSLASDAHSAAAQTNSRVLLVQSRLSDFDSRLVSDLSDIYSAAVQTNSRALVLQSSLSDVASAMARHDANMVMRRNTVAGAAANGVTLDAGAGTTNSLYNDMVIAIVAGTGAGQVRSIDEYVGASKNAQVTPNWEITPVAGDSFVLLTNRTDHSHVTTIQSRLSDFDSRMVSDISDVRSALLVVQSMASDAASAAIQANSRVLLTQSLASDAHSAAAQANSRVLLVQSLASDAHSAAAQANSRVLVLSGVVSDIYSALSAGVELGASSMSDIRSAVAAVTVNLTVSDISDIASAVAAAVTTVSPSDISDIASAVWAHAIGARVDSRVLLVQSQASDIYSQVAAGVSLDASTMSDLRSAITAGGGGIDTSDLSDIASAVWANTIGARVDSRVLLTQSLASDAHSAAAQANSRVLLTQSLASTAAATGAQVNSRVLLVQSTASDVYSLLSNLHADVAIASGVQSDIYSLLSAGVEVGASSMSDLRSAITATELDASDLSDIASAVWARAGADPTGVVGVTAAMGAKLDWLTALGRNQITQTSGVQTLYDDSLSAIASAAVADDGSVFTRGEFA